MQGKTVKCEACGNRFYELSVRECPKKPGHYICLYCCQKCKRHYKAGAMVGCRAWDKEHREREGHE